MLAEALASRIASSTPPSKFNSDSPANMAIKLLDDLILGENVGDLFGSVDHLMLALM